MLEAELCRMDVERNGARLQQPLPAAGVPARPARRTRRVRHARCVPDPAWRDRPVYLWPATPNAYTVVLVNVCDGRRTVDGNSGWFGESG